MEAVDVMIGEGDLMIVQREIGFPMLKERKGSKMIPNLETVLLHPF